MTVRTYEFTLCYFFFNRTIAAAVDGSTNCIDFCAICTNMVKISDIVRKLDAAIFAQGTAFVIINPLSKSFSFFIRLLNIVIAIGIVVFSNCFSTFLNIF